MSGFWRLNVADSFAAAHALRHYQGKCERLHGHNFNVDACLQGKILQPDVEILLDFKIIKDLLKTVLQQVDHQVLNELPAFAKLNPSSENLARFIYENLSSELNKLEICRQNQLRLLSVTVSEKPGQSATYFGAD